MSAPKAPTGLGKAGRRLWRQLHADLDYEQHEMPLVKSACELADRIGELEALVADQGLTQAGSAGQRVLHPAVAEARQCRLAQARILGQIAVADADGRMHNARSQHAHRAAVGRWGQPPAG